MCSSSNFIRLIKYIEIFCVWYVAYNETDEVHEWFWWGDLMAGVNVEFLNVDGKTILKWIINKWHGCRIALIWLRKGTVGDIL